MKKKFIVLSLAFMFFVLISIAHVDEVTVECESTHCTGDCDCTGHGWNKGELECTFGCYNEEFELTGQCGTEDCVSKLEH